MVPLYFPVYFPGLACPVVFSPRFQRKSLQRKIIMLHRKKIY